MRRRAFTLIEVLTVCAILAMTAALVTPNFVALKASRDRQEAYKAVLRLAQKGRESAIQEGRTYVLALESGTTITLQRDKKEDTKDVDPRQTPLGDQAEREDVGSVALPEGVTMGDLVVANQPSNSSDFALHFYPDGRSDGGGLEMVENGTKRNLAVDVRGLATMQDGDLPQAGDDRWEAGQYEQRVTG